jgi:protein-tyrosine phosphatase
MSGRARQFTSADWERFDYVMAMDVSNHDALADLAPDAAARSKLALLRSFDPAAPKGAAVPDPYFGAQDGFETVLDQCEAACRGLLARIRQEHGI